MTEHDRLLLLALDAYEADLCPGCGHPRTESMDPAHDKRDPVHTAAYAAGAPFRCFACTELDQAQRGHARAVESVGQDPDSEMAGLKWITELIPRRTDP